MKKVISRILIILIVFILLYEFVFSSFLGLESYALVDSVTRGLVFNMPNLAGRVSLYILYTIKSINRWTYLCGAIHYNNNSRCFWYF